MCTVYLPHGFFPPLKKKNSCTLSCAKWLGRCSAVCFSDPPRSLFPSSRCMPPCSCVPLLPPRRSMHQTWSMFPAPSARQASGLSRVGNGHFDLGIKGFLSEGNRFRPKKSKQIVQKCKMAIHGFHGYPTISIASMDVHVYPYNPWISKDFNGNPRIVYPLGFFPVTFSPSCLESLM